MGDADLYEPADLFAPVEASKLEPYTKKKPSPRHIRTDFVCKMCANTKNGVGAPTCEKCLGQLNRIMAVYTEAARMIPAVQGMKLSEFVERLWQREKRRRFQAK